MTPQTPDEDRINEMLKEAINDFDMAKASAGREVSFSYWFRDVMKTTLATVRKEAYKKGYADGSIAEINKHNHEH